MDDLPIFTLGFILLTASLVAMMSRRFRLPYSVGLVAAGIAIAFLPIDLDLTLSKDLIFTVFLPPLVFEAALQLEWRPFRQDLPVTLALAFFGVVLSAAVVAVGVHTILGWSWIGALMFGTLIAATDPVSVIAAFKELKVEHRLSLIVESESLLNDGTAAVGFGIVALVAAGASASPVFVAETLIWTIVGGVAVGALVTSATLLIAGRTEDHLVEITLTTLAAYGSFLIAEHLQMSGVLASMTAGLLVRNIGWKRSISKNGQGHVLAFWQYAAFLTNSVVFILIGTQEAEQPLSLVIPAACTAIALTLIGRAAAVYPICAMARGPFEALPTSYQHVLAWGGLKGALALALALALPMALPERREIIVVSFAVVAFSIFVQGLTMPWLVRRFGLSRESKETKPADGAGKL